MRAPKLYLRDSGLCHALLDLPTWEAVLGHPVAGPSFEGFAIENLLAAAGPGVQPFFYRTEDGAEVDLVLERGGEIAAAIEIKRSTAPVPTKGFQLACAVLRPKAAFVVHGDLGKGAKDGSSSWPLGGGATAISLPALMKRLARR